MIICFLVSFQTTYFCEEVSMLTGAGVIICFVVCLHTTYFCDDVILLTGACKWEHADGSMQMEQFFWPSTLKTNDSFALMRFNLSH